MENDLPAIPRGKSYGGIGWLFCALVFIAPFVYLESVRKYATAPKEALIQSSILAICAAWIITERRRVKAPAAFIAALIFTTYAAATLLWAVNPYEGASTALHWLICSLAILITANIVDKDRLLLTIFLGGFGIAGIGLLQKYGGLDFIPQSFEPGSTMANAKKAAHYVTFCVAFGLYFRRWPYVAGMALMIFFIVITGSKLSMAIVALMVLFAMCVCARRRFCRAIFTPLIVLIVIAGAYKSFDMIRSNGSVAIRTQIYKEVLPMVKDFPAGVGVENAKLYYSLYGVENSTKIQVGALYSDLLQVLIETGFAGFTLLILAIIASIKGFDWSDGRAHYVFASISSIGIVALLDFPMFLPMPPFLLACLLGVSQK